MRKTAILLCISALSLLFCACHGQKGNPEFVIPDKFDESNNYEITFWAKNDTNKVQAQVYKDAISAFEDIYPNIKVNLRLYTDYGKIYNDVITNISTNTTPNVCITYPDHIATYMSGSNVVVPLDELMIDPKYGLAGNEVRFDAPSKNEIIDKFLSECILQGKYYALPYMRSSEVTYINKTMVEQLGYEVPDILTWDYIFEVSEKAMQKDASGKYAINSDNVLIPFIYKSTDNMLISMKKQLNAPVSDDNGNVMLFDDVTKDILLNLAPHAKSGAFSTFKISSYPANFLNAGQCIFAVDSTAGATWMGSDAPLIDIAAESVKQFETVVRMIPQYDINNPQMISQGPSICIFNKADPQEVLASWLFTQFLLTNDVQIPYSQTEGYVPVTSKAYESKEYVDYLNSEGKDNDLHYDVKIKATKLLLENTDNTFVTSVFKGSSAVRDASGALIEDVTKAQRRNINVDEAFIQKDFENVKSLYRIDQIKAGNGTPSDVGDDLGPLPKGAKALLIVLCITWVCIIAYYIYDKRAQSNRD